MTTCAQHGGRVLDSEAIATLHGASICRACYERTCNPHHGLPPEYGRREERAVPTPAVTPRR